MAPFWQLASVQTEATRYSLYEHREHSCSRRCADFRRTGSAALDLAYVAAGRVDGFFEIGLKQVSLRVN